MSYMSDKPTRRPKIKTHDSVYAFRLPPAFRQEIERQCEQRPDRPTMAQWLREAIAAKIKKDGGRT